MKNVNLSFDNYCAIYVEYVKDKRYSIFNVEEKFVRYVSKYDLESAIVNGKLMFDFNTLKLVRFDKNYKIILFENINNNMISYFLCFGKNDGKRISNFVKDLNVDERFKKYVKIVSDIFKRN